jgi:hypothetical protein
MEMLMTKISLFIMIMIIKIVIDLIYEINLS